MKRFFVVLVLGVITLAAVEWEVEQVTNTTEVDNFDPILVLDAQGNARVLYGEWGTQKVVTLVVASNQTGSWQFENVAQAFDPQVYGLDVDADGSSYVVYFDFVSGTISDIFFATNKNGPFSPVNVTEDSFFQHAPVLKLDRAGMPHLVFAQAVNPGAQLKLWHGWINAEGFEREQVTDNLNQIWEEDWLGYDLVFDQLDRPHVFYVGDDNYLWHVTRGESHAWQSEKINQLSSRLPSAAADPAGSLHVAYRVADMNIHYATNLTGSWRDEPVSSRGDRNWGPLLALDQATGNPRIAWMRHDETGRKDLWFVSKPEDAWLEQMMTTELDEHRWPGDGHYFAIDNQNYGHIVYSYPDEAEVWQIFHAKTRQSLAGP